MVVECERVWLLWNYSWENKRGDKHKIEELRLSVVCLFFNFCVQKHSEASCEQVDKGPFERRYLIPVMTGCREL